MQYGVPFHLRTLYMQEGELIKLFLQVYPLASHNTARCFFIYCIHSEVSTRPALEKGQGRPRPPQHFIVPSTFIFSEI